MTRRLELLPTGRKVAGKKKTVYLISIAGVLLLISLTAFIFLLNTAEKRTEEYTQKARNCYDSGDYEGALLYLRRLKTDGKDNEAVLMLMADCYEAMGNYEHALDVLRRMNTSNPAIADRVQTIEQKKVQRSQKEKLSIGGVELEFGAKSAILDNCNITNEQLEDISALYTLDSLSLQNNRITDIQPLVKLGGLNELNLTGNQIRDLSAISEMKGLRTLILDQNPIEDCTPLYGLNNLNMISLREINLDKDALEQLSESLPLCGILCNYEGSDTVLLGNSRFRMGSEELTLSGKGIKDISIIGECRNLKILDLSGNEISDLRPLMELSCLEQLCISNNTVSDLRPLIGLPTLNVLEAADNLIIETMSVGAMSGLRELCLKGNQIADFSGLEKLTGLEVLDLRNTELTDASLPYLYSLLSLHSLDLRENTGLSDKAIGTLKSTLGGCGVLTSELVYEIDISGHAVRSDEKKLSFPSCGIMNLNGLERLTCLEELNLSGNEIISLYQLEISPSRSTIKKIDLSDNQILDVLSLCNLTEVEELDLSENQIEIVAGLKKLKTLKRLDLSGNPLSIDAVNELREALPNCDIMF